MVEAYSNATRMLLNVRIKAPIIIVPVDSQSLKAISIDLGHLNISNNCTDIPNSAVVSHFKHFADVTTNMLKNDSLSQIA